MTPDPAAGSLERQYEAARRRNARLSPDASLAPPQVPLLRLDLAQTLRKLHRYHGDRPWTGRDFAVAADVLASMIEERHV